MCAILPPEFFQYGVAGVPVPSIEIKLLDVPEAGYFANGKPAEGGQPAKPQQGKGDCTHFNGRRLILY